MSPDDRNRAWLSKIERKLSTLPTGERIGSVTIHFTEGREGAVIRHLDWHRRDTTVDSDERDRIAS